MIISNKKLYKPIEKIKVICKYCGNRFMGHKKNVYCSRNCGRLYNLGKTNKKYIPRRKNLLNKQCKNCEKEYLGLKFQKYCSEECCKQFNKEQYRKITLGIIEPKQNISGGFLKLRFEIFKRDNFQCKYCGRTPRFDNCKLVIDHIIPRNLGGGNTSDNLITSCHECNSGKRDFLLNERGLIKNA